MVCVGPAIEVAFEGRARLRLQVSLTTGATILTMLLTDVRATAYGGALVNLLVSDECASELRQQSIAWPSWDLSRAQCALLELLCNGVLSPLRGFMTRREYESVISSRELPDGRAWALPVVLEISAALASQAGPHSSIVLRDAEGVMLARLQVEEIWADAAESTEPRWFAGGPVAAVAAPTHFDFRGLRLPPSEVRDRFLRSDATGAIAMYASSPIGASLAKRVEEFRCSSGAWLLVHALTVPAAADDASHYWRVRTHQAALEHVAHDRALLALLELPSCGSARGDLMTRAIVSRNFGCTQLLVTSEDDAAHLDDPSFVEFLERQVGMSAVRLPGDGRDAAERAKPAREAPRGFAVFFTGLSGSGKSTIANVLLIKLLERTGRAVTLLDGDLVRKHLSSELGFSREHREINIRRIGFVASEIAKHGGIAMCAPIAPYADTRAEVRVMVQAVGGFFLVHVATPLDVCEARDRKGLYAKARAGVIPQFTGISDPYEPPEDADLTIDTANMSAEQAAELIVEQLHARGYLDR